MFFRFILFLPPLFFFISCDNDPSKNIPGYSGRVGEVIVVVDPKYSESGLNDSIRSILAQDQQGLTKVEPVFDLIFVDKKSFSHVFETHRNIVMCTISDTLKERVEIKKNVWARDQCIITIYAHTASKLISLLASYSNPILKKIQEFEIKRLIDRNKEYGNIKLSDKIQEKHNIDLILQKECDLAIDSSSCFWLRMERERPLGGYQHQISQGILIHYYNYTDSNSFSLNHILNKKDSITKKYILGPTPNSYMITSDRHGNILHEEINFKGQYAVETKGVWRMQNGFMAGPFTCLTIYDSKQNRIIMAMGYVYAPQFDKREYLREVDAIIKSITY